MFIAEVNNGVRIRGSFLNLMSNWIENYRDSSLDKFALTCSMPQNNHDDVTRCITFCVDRKVNFFWLDFSDPTWIENDNINREAKFDLPMNVYDRKIVRSLKLFSCNFVMPEFKNFKWLRQLSLGWIRLSYSTLKALIENCELLASLSLKNCWNTEAIEINGPNLQL
ncbi:LRR domain containing protein [Parasponia andersonii]|uniref:LRR domain containing protein n=1 Tax=Parasponia andersonii TaxID=3476 RepID=A0A2P5AD77_PARAD|nr:LRR domain containing protein [Parasponia andersonii]